jgi:hypothetical protein
MDPPQKRAHPLAYQHLLTENSFISFAANLRPSLLAAILPGESRTKRPQYLST